MLIISGGAANRVILSIPHCKQDLLHLASFSGVSKMLHDAPSLLRLIAKDVAPSRNPEQLLEQCESERPRPRSRLLKIGPVGQFECVISYWFRRPSTRLSPLASV